MSEFRLPRLPSRFPIADRNGAPTLDFQRWWQNVVGDIEQQVNDILAAREAAGLVVVGPTTATIEAATDGTVAGGELPANYTYSLESDGVEVASGVTWAVSVTEGTATVSISTAGLLTLSALTSNTASIRVQATYGGVVKALVFSVRKRIASVDINTGSGGTSATDNSFDSFNTESYVAVSDELAITTGSAGEVDLTAPLTFRVLSSNPPTDYEADLKWQRDNGGSWVDVGSVVGAVCTVEPDGTVVAGYPSITASETLAASTSYTYRLVAKAVWTAEETINGTGRDRYLTGTASASGS